MLHLQSTASGKVGLKVCHPRSEAASRAVGPKNIHAGRTLVFLPPHQYKGRSMGPSSHQPARVPSTHPRHSKVHIQALNFDVMEPKIIRGGLSTSPSRVQYHTLAGSIHRHSGAVGRQYKQDTPTDMSVLPMEIITTPRADVLITGTAS